jgi:hypothetical protein
MEKRRSSENIKQVFEYVTHSLSFIETKNGVFLTLIGGLMAAIIAFAGENHSFWFYLWITPSVIALCPLLWSFYPIPKQDSKKTNPQADNVYLFRCEDIENTTIEKLETLLAEGESLSFLERQKIEFIYKTSCVTSRKYRLFRKALKLFFWLYSLVVILYALNLLICK